MTLPVLYVDNHMLVVSKPPGLLAQGDQTGDASILSLGKAYVKAAFDKPGNVYLGLVHRLDRPSSGLMVLARTSKAMRRLSEQFRERRVEKRYVALVEGNLTGEGVWEDYLVRDQRRMRVVASQMAEAKRAILHWTAVAHHEGLTLVSIQLLTGRRHQIRCQFAHYGAPLLGDVRYGASRPLDGRNIALHAWQLTVQHPVEQQSMAFEAPIPPVWSIACAPAMEKEMRGWQRFAKTSKDRWSTG